MAWRLKKLFLLYWRCPCCVKRRMLPWDIINWLIFCINHCMIIWCYIVITSMKLWTHCFATCLNSSVANGDSSSRFWKQHIQLNPVQRFWIHAHSFKSKLGRIASTFMFWLVQLKISSVLMEFFQYRIQSLECLQTFGSHYNICTWLDQV